MILPQGYYPTMVTVENRGIVLYKVITFKHEMIMDSYEIEIFRGCFYIYL